MQYKIPVQIENEDRIVLGLSLRQLMIILVGGAVAYGVFQRVAGMTGQGAGDGNKVVGGILAFIIVAIAWFIAVFNNHEMTFVPFVLNWLRLRVNGTERVWGQGVDSVAPLQVGFVTSVARPDQKKSNAKAQHEIYASLEDKLKSL